MTNDPQITVGSVTFGPPTPAHLMAMGYLPSELKAALIAWRDAENAIQILRSDAEIHRSDAEMRHAFGMAGIARDRVLALIKDLQ